MTRLDESAAIISGELGGGRRLWTMSAQQGSVQGPLDLEFFTEEGLRLSLADGQLALVERSGVLVDILGPGEHDVDGGNSGRAYFLQTDRPVTCRWSEGAVLWLGSRTSRRAVPIIGSCALVVTDVADFHRAFLQGAGCQADGSWARVLDAAVRSQLEARLGHVADEGPADPATIQTLLAHVTAADLGEDLAEFGLACVHLAIYTRQGPLFETSLAGHLPRHHDNNA